MNKQWYCTLFGHKLVIPQYPKQNDPIYCSRCGDHPVEKHLETIRDHYNIIDDITGNNHE